MESDEVVRVPSPLVRSDFAEPSIFAPENLLREARRQRRLSHGPMPDVCMLDPDGDVVRFLQETGRGQRSDVWACYHTEMWLVTVAGMSLGVVGNAVGAPFAVLIAEEFFASGGGLVVSVTSAGQLDHTMTLPRTILVERALRGEGTSHAYIPPSPFAEGDPCLLAAVAAELESIGLPAIRGATWTTDAPFRETASAIAEARACGLQAVEMEVAGLYAFATARRKPVACFALVTNQMAVAGDDFEKGAFNGAEHALAVAAAAGRGWHRLAGHPVPANNQDDPQQERARSES
jgi:uridine phosphorylase